MNQHTSEFKILEIHFPEVIDALHTLALDKERYAWVISANVLEHTKQFEEIREDEQTDEWKIKVRRIVHGAMRAWRWETSGDDGNITGIDFTGEKSGEDMALFEAIAPFVEEGSYIQMCGEDGEQWRWMFSGGQCTERYATVTWT